MSFSSHFTAAIADREIQLKGKTLDERALSRRAHAFGISPKTARREGVSKKQPCVRWRRGRDSNP
jgi:hypothetical protein